ncbi:MAG: FAD-dependent thymidylate synthase [Chitinophagales bacterium]
MKVKLIAWTPDPERTVALAARMCYSGKDIDDIEIGLDPDEVKRRVDLLTSVGHFSPTEHSNFTFLIGGISRACSHQLVRHRIASYSQKSQRYVNEKAFNYVIPPSIAENPEILAEFEKQMQQIADGYNKLAEMVPREDARYVLPNATATQLIMTINTRSLHNFFRQRLCQRAQWEIRELAEKMLQEVMTVAPALFAKAGPSCEVDEICWEGEKSCGRCEDVRER